MNVSHQCSCTITSTNKKGNLLLLFVCLHLTLEVCIAVTCCLLADRKIVLPYVFLMMVTLVNQKRNILQEERPYFHT